MPGASQSRSGVDKHHAMPPAQSPIAMLYGQELLPQILMGEDKQTRRCSCSSKQLCKAQSPDRNHPLRAAWKIISYSKVSLLPFGYECLCLFFFLPYCNGWMHSTTLIEVVACFCSYRESTQPIATINCRICSDIMDQVEEVLFHIYFAEGSFFPPSLWSEMKL